MAVRACALVVITAGAMPVLAHPPGTVDLNTLAFNQVWPLLGPEGTFDQTTGPIVGGLPQEVQDAVAQRRATREGTVLTNSVTHHGDATHTITFLQCGDPDLTVGSKNPFFHSSVANGIFEATGRFFVDVEISGPKASQVDRVEFGYLHTFPWPVSSWLCAGPFPLPGAYYELYRGDNNGADGWEIPVNTLLVPDLAYGALVRALDIPPGCTVPSCAITLKVGFVYANVNNHREDYEYKPAVPVTCPPDAVGQITCPHDDITPPFPFVKGALGRARNPNCPGITAEYGELLSSFSASSGTVTEIASTPRDVDPIAGVTVSAQVWGPTYCITGAGLPLTFSAVDQQGNMGYRTI